MSADLPNDQTNEPRGLDMSALDAALREMLYAVPQANEQQGETLQETILQETILQETILHDDKPLALEETMDVVSRAASTINELVERNRSITNAAVRSVEFFRAQAAEARTEAERLRNELRVLQEQSEAQRVAALAQAQELEAELAARTADLGKAQAWIGEIRSQVENLLGDAETRLSETSDDHLFGG